MKHTKIILYLLGGFIIILIFQSFYPQKPLDNNQQRLLAKTNLFNLQFPQEKIYLHTDRSFYWANDDIWFKAYLLNSPIPNCNLHVELINSAGEVVLKKLCWIQNGLAYGDMHIADTISSGVYQIRAYTNWMRNFDDNWFFRKNMLVWNLRDKDKSKYLMPVTQKDVDLQFFPESGTFISGIENRVAFKATDKNGKGLDIKGRIVDDLGNEISRIKSDFKGMGSFLIEPKDNRSYLAMVTIANKFMMKTNLPVPKPEGILLSVASSDNNQIHLQTKTTGNFQLCDYLIVAQAKGQIVYQKEFNSGKGTCDIIIEKKGLPTGIVQFTLFNKDLLPLCERLVFINNHDFVNIEVIPEKTVYAPREKIQLHIKTLSKDGFPYHSNLSLSVYNIENELKFEEYPDNILTRFLLSSELKGLVEEPAYYFKDDSTRTLQSLDNLLLTQGFRHFEWKEIMEDKYPEINYQPEECIQVKGTVKSILLEKPVPNSKVTMIFLKSQLAVHEQTSDSLGRFLFSDLYFNDTVYVSLQTVSKKGRRNSFIELDNQSSVSPKTKNLHDEYQYIEANPVNTVSYLSEQSSELINRKWHLRDTIILGDVNILAKKKIKDDGNFRMYKEADYVFDMSKQDDVLANIYDAIDGRIPGVRQEMTDTGEMEFIYRGKPVLLYLNGIPADNKLISTYPSQAFDKVELVKMGTFSGVNYSGGILYFYTKRGKKFENPPTDALGMKSTRIIGYSVIRKFYSPDYETVQSAPEKKDYRSTIFWEPVVRTDSAGVAKAVFYNSDQIGEVRIVVEGITSDGKLCRGLGGYKVSNR